jgi:peptidoglycan/xylan/chitin deacetylase (PgdA/CDA1 family)
VVFSFDDGPNAQGDTTARLLEVLRKHEVRALFALLGENAERNPELVRRIREEGHGIINHGYSSRFSLWMGDAEFAANLSRGEAVISAALGEYPAPRLYRPQGGFYRPGQQRIWRDAGYTLVPGTARIYDAVLSPRDKDRAVAKLLGIIEKQGGGVILLHDGRDSHRQMAAALAQNPRGPYDRSWIPAAVEELIVLLEAKGYTLRGPALVFRE